MTKIMPIVNEALTIKQEMTDLSGRMTDLRKKFQEEPAHYAELLAECSYQQGKLAERFDNLMLDVKARDARFNWLKPWLLLKKK